MRSNYVEVHGNGGAPSAISSRRPPRVWNWTDAETPIGKGGGKGKVGRSLGVTKWNPGFAGLHAGYSLKRR